MDKILHIGDLFPYRIKRAVPVFVRIQNTRGYLSFTGVVGPNRSGNCYGSAGQIIMSWADQLSKMIPAKGWNKDKIEVLFETWNKWHMKNNEDVSDLVLAYIDRLPSSDKIPAWA